MKILVYSNMYSPEVRMERNWGIIADKADLSSSTSTAAYINSMYLEIKTHVACSQQ